MLTDTEIAELLVSCMDLDDPEQEKDGTFHRWRSNNGEYEIEGDTLLLGGDSFYGYPLSLTLLRQAFAKMGER